MTTERKTFKALGALLTYPEEDLIEAISDIGHVIADEKLLSHTAQKRLLSLLDHLGRNDLMDAQEQYIQLFDRSRTLSLHLYEHVHGESRERGPAMVNLREVYRRYGFEMDSRELPDFLPVLAEFLSQVPEVTAREILGDAQVVLDAIRVRLDQRESPYAAVFAALVELAGKPVDTAEVEAQLKAAGEEDSDDLEAMDRAWEEAAVTFGAGDALQGSCPMVHRPPAQPPAA